MTWGGHRRSTTVTKAASRVPDRPATVLQQKYWTQLMYLLQQAIRIRDGFMLYCEGAVEHINGYLTGFG